jgi:hypothetical protein
VFGTYYRLKDAAGKPLYCNRRFTLYVVRMGLGQLQGEDANFKPYFVLPQTARATGMFLTAESCYELEIYPEVRRLYLPTYRSQGHCESNRGYVETVARAIELPTISEYERNSLKEQTHTTIRLANMPPERPRRDCCSDNSLQFWGW